VNTVNDLYSLKQDFNKRGIFLSFSGPVSQSLVVEIGATLKKKMKLEEASKSTVLRVFSAVVENAQNILHYSAENNFGIIAVGGHKNCYFVLSLQSEGTRIVTLCCAEIQLQTKKWNRSGKN